MILSGVIWAVRIIVCLVLSAAVFFVTYVLLSWLASIAAGATESAAVDIMSWLGSDNLWAGMYEEGSGLLAILPLVVSIAIGGVVFYKTYTFRVFR